MGETVRPGESFVAEVLHALDDQGAGNILLVTPTRRLQRYLGRYQLERTGQRVVRLPRMMTYADVVREVIAGQGRPTTSGSAGVALLRRALSRDPEAFTTFFPAEYLSGLPSFMAVADSLIGFFNELHGEALTLDHLGHHLLYTDMERHVAALSRLEAAFRAEQEAEGLFVPSFLFASITAEHILDVFGELDAVWLLAPGALTATERRIYRTAGSRCPVILREPGGVPTPFADYHPPHPTEVPTRPATVFRVPGLMEQSARVAALILESLEQGIAADRIALLNTDPNFTELVTQHVTALGVPVNLSAGIPAARQPMFQFLSLVREAVGSHYHHSHFLDLLANPFFRRLLPTVGTAFFHRLAAAVVAAGIFHFRPLDPRQQDRLLEAGGDADGLAILRDTLRFLEELTSAADAAALTTSMLELLHRLGDFAVPRFHLFRDTCREGLQEMILLEESGFEPATGRAFAAFMDWLGRQSIVELGDTFNGVQLLGLLETRGLGFDRVIIPSANERILPAPMPQNYFLSTELRRLLGLTTYREHEDLQEYYLARLGQVGELVFVSVQDEAGRYNVPSRFIGRFRAARGDSDGPPPVFPWPRREAQPPPPALEAPADLVRPRLRSEFSRMDLEMLNTCRMKYFLSRLLGLADSASIEDEVTLLDIGQVVHEVLKTFYRVRPPRMGRDDPPLDVLDAIFRQAFRAHQRPGPEVPFVEETLRQRLRAFVRFDAQRLAASGREPCVEFLEQPLEFALGPYKIRGRLDRVDRDGERLYHVVDYKTGTSGPGIAHTAKRNFEKMQLAVYGLLLRTGAGVSRIGSLGYLHIQDPPSAETVITGDVDAYLDAFEDYLQRMLDAFFSDPVAGINPDPQHCRYCPFAQICRVNEATCPQTGREV